MKTTEHLCFLQKIRTKLNSIKEVDDIGKELLDDIIKFCEIDENLVYEDLLNQENRTLFLNEYQKLISESKNIFVIRKLIFDEFLTNKLFDKLTFPYHFKLNIAQKELHSYSNKERDLNSQLESWCMKYDNDSNEIINLTKELDFAKQEYNIFKLKLKIIEDEKNDAFNCHLYLLSFSFKAFIDKLNVVESNVSRLTESNNFSQNVFKNENAILLAFSVFVKNNLLKEIPYLDFYNQTTLSKTLTLEKNKSKDKYIAYAINKLKDFVIESKKEIWEEKLVQHFEIKDYGKKKTVNDKEIKTKEHKKIDAEIEQYFENLKP